MDNAYWLWTFQGRLLQKNNKDRFCQLLWRPRPPTLLSAEQIKVQFLLCIVCVCVCSWVCKASDDKHNFSDTSYESCTVAPDSSSNLRLPATPPYRIVHHVLWWWVCDCEAICHVNMLSYTLICSLADDQKGSEEILKDLWAEGSSEPVQGF